MYSLADRLDRRDEGIWKLAVTRRGRSIVTAGRSRESGFHEAETTALFISILEHRETQYDCKRVL